MTAPDGYWKPGEGVWYQVVVSKEPAEWTDAQGNKLAVADFSNTPTVVSWRKADAASTSTLLGGSEWTIQQLDDNNQPVNDRLWSVTDCVNANQCKPSTDGLKSPRDTDPAAGKFTVQGLPAGTYTLTESKAPGGYVKFDKSYTFTIGDTAESSKLTFGDGNVVVNAKAVSVLPFTGGRSARDWLLAGGGLLAGAAAWLAVLDARRRREAMAV
ncbi:prealbumin-like fold domain-containing protein [Bifidobacterium vespertilionis]|uniref:prealbumin-like fold domain-containing protein n=1 Tax=Bifidobacterium vespertilionis TaxID=2562524 RepID=UPI0030B84D11